MIYEGYWIVI